MWLQVLGGGAFLPLSGASPTGHFCPHLQASQHGGGGAGAGALPLAGGSISKAATITPCPGPRRFNENPQLLCSVA